MDGSGDAGGPLQPAGGWGYALCALVSSGRGIEDAGRRGGAGGGDGEPRVNHPGRNA